QENLLMAGGLLAEGQRARALKALVAVQLHIFAGVELRLGEETLTLRDDGMRVCFRLVRNEEELNITMAPFSGSLR
ncbi:MAG: hypothetical protein AB1505_32510, partial [Candidatus Latescibacterota bacterium]